MKNCSRGKRGPGSAVLPEELMRTPGVEPGSQAWEACMMPLHYVRSHEPLESHPDIQRGAFELRIVVEAKGVQALQSCQKSECARRESNPGHKHGRLV